VKLVDLGKSAPINDAARALHGSLRGFGLIPQQQRLSDARQLHDAVLRPIQAQLSAKRALTVVADGALHYIPFGVLQDKQAGRFVIQDYDVALAPSVRMLFQRRAGQQEPPSAGMLLVADPVYGEYDSRVASNGPVSSAPRPARTSIIARQRGGEADAARLARLPGTGAEAQAIRQLFRASQLDTLEGTTATRDRFLKTDFHNYRYIHIASHAVADAEIPQLSALILSTV